MQHMSIRKLEKKNASLAAKFNFLMHANSQPAPAPPPAPPPAAPASLELFVSLNGFKAFSCHKNEAKTFQHVLAAFGAGRK